MDCPSSNRAVAFQPQEVHLGIGPDPVKGNIQARSMLCPACGRAIVVLRGTTGAANGSDGIFSIWPRSTGRPPAPHEVPGPIAQDYRVVAQSLADELESAFRSRGGVWF